MTFIAVPRALQAKTFNGYSDFAQSNKDAFHRTGKTFLRKLAAELGLASNQFSVRSNPAGIAVSGEVTLHADNLYVQLCQSYSSEGLTVLFRGCVSQKDYTGLNNQYASISDLADEDRQPNVIRRFQAAMAQGKEKASA